MYYVYVLLFQYDHGIYIGYTKNLRVRLNQHNKGKTSSIKHRGPFSLLYYEALPTSDEALAREQFYKSGRGHEVLHKILYKSLQQPPKS